MKMPRFFSEQFAQYQSWLKPVHPRPDILRLFDPLVAALAGSALVMLSALGFAAFGVVLSCAFLAFLVLTRVFGISLDLDPQLFRQFTGEGPSRPS